MKIVNDKLTASYRKPGKCRWCGKSCKMLCGAHVFAKGHGGGRQVDIPCNLVSLGMNAITDCDCHAAHHGGNRPLQCDLLAVSAADHGCAQDDIRALRDLILRLPKEADERMFRLAVAKNLNRSAQRLALNQLVTFAHLLRESAP